MPVFEQQMDFWYQAWEAVVKEKAYLKKASFNKKKKKASQTASFSENGH